MNPTHAKLTVRMGPAIGLIICTHVPYMYQYLYIRTLRVINLLMWPTPVCVNLDWQISSVQQFEISSFKWAFIQSQRSLRHGK